MKISKTAALVGSLFALAAQLPAQAAVTLSPASNVVVPATTSGVYLNVVTGVFATTQAGAPGWDINPWGSTALGFFTSATAASAYVAATGTGAAISLAPGSTIGAASTFSTATANVTFGAAAGNWSLNSTNYFGFRFTGEDALVHYGYGTMLVGATAAARTIGQLWYESTPGASITVVPEASTWGMMLAGGVLMGALVRRRQAAR